MAKSRPIIALLLTFGLLGVPSIAPAVGASNEAIWSQVNIPAGGEAGGWVLAEGSDVRHLALADDGTLYASVDGLGYTLYRSGDGGYSWSHCGGVTNAIVDIVVAADGIGTVYCATEGSIYRSTNAGEYGGVYILEEGTFPRWFDIGIGGFDVYAVAFSPRFSDDQQIVAVVTDETIATSLPK
jgi:hypothetical protein